MEDDSNEIIRLDAENERLRKRLSGALQHLEEAREGLANAIEEIAKLRRDLAQARGNLSLAEEGLANATQEIHDLKVALNFWLPMVPEDAPLDEHAALSRIERDSRLLFKFEGDDTDDQCASELGWVTLHVHPTTG